MDINELTYMINAAIFEERRELGAGFLERGSSLRGNFRHYSSASLSVSACPARPVECETYSSGVGKNDRTGVGLWLIEQEKTHSACPAKCLPHGMLRPIPPEPQHYPTGAKPI